MAHNMSQTLLGDLLNIENENMSQAGCIFAEKAGLCFHLLDNFFKKGVSPTDPLLSISMTIRTNCKVQNDWVSAGFLGHPDAEYKIHLFYF